MTIGEVARKFDLSLDTLRYYEKVGLISPVSKVSGRREYSDENINELKFVLCMKNAGLSLKDILKFTEYGKKGDETLPERLDILKKQREVLTSEIEEKKETLNYLNYKINLYEGKIGK